MDICKEAVDFIKKKKLEVEFEEYLDSQDDGSDGMTENVLRREDIEEELLLLLAL